MSTPRPLMDHEESFLCKKKIINVLYMYTAIVHHDLFLCMYENWEIENIFSDSY